MSFELVPASDISRAVRIALEEDIGPGDRTAALVDENLIVHAKVDVRERAVLCGTKWFEEAFHQIDDSVYIFWEFKEGDWLDGTDPVCYLHGKARSLLSGERTALNFLQMLSSTATVTRIYVDDVADCKSRILDTRKTIPGLRSAQKYAVRIGGGENHRTGLYDGILIKENHQYITQSLDSIICNLPDDRNGIKFVEVEIECLDQLESAINSGADRVMLDNFHVKDIKEAVKINNNRVELEASGNFNSYNIRDVAETGVDYISIGALTKNVRAIDYSMTLISL